MLLLLCVVLAGCAQKVSNDTSNVPIRLGTYEWPGSYWIEVAWQKGWFKEAGLNVERVDTNLRYFESLDAVAAGEIDGMGFTQFDLVRYVADGHDLVGVAAVDYSDGAEALVSRAGISGLSGLKGRRIGLKRNTYLEYLLSIAAVRAGLDLDDVTLVDLAGYDSVRELSAGRVDAIFVWEPYVTQALAAVESERLFTTADFPGLTYNVFAMQRDFVNAHPGEVRELLRVWHRAARFILENPDDASELVARSFAERVETVRDLMRTDQVLDMGDNQRAFSYAGGFESLHGSWRRMNDFMIERGLVDRRIDSPEHLDSRFIRSVD